MAIVHTKVITRQMVAYISTSVAHCLSVGKQLNHAENDCLVKKQSQTKMSKQLLTSGAEQLSESLTG